MVLETQILPFVEWLQVSGRHWLLVVGALFVVGVVFGWLVAAMRQGPVAAFPIVGRTLIEAVSDLVRISPRRVGSLAWLAVKEATRRRLVVVVVFAVFVLVLLFAGWFLDRTSVHPSRLYISFVLTSTSYLMVLLALFLSALSLPADIKDKTLHTIVTKPVRPSEIVLGRIVGFTAVGTLLLVLMGAVSYAFVVRGLSHTHDMAQTELDVAAEACDAAILGDQSPAALRFRTGNTDGHRHNVAVNVDVASEENTTTGRVRTGVTQDHWHEFTYEISTGPSKDAPGTKVGYSLGSPQEQLIARVPVYGKLRFKDRTGADAKQGVNVGDEWTYRSFIAGGTAAAAIWTFDGITEDRFPDGLPLEMTLEVFRTYKGDTSDVTDIPGILGALSVRNPASGKRVQAKVFSAMDFTTDLQLIPRELTQTTDDQKLDLFKDLVSDGKVEVWLECLDSAQYFGAAQPDLYLRARNASFELNFVMGYLGIWAQMVMVIGIGVMFSTFLSAPIALVATLGTLVPGMFETVYDFMNRLAAGDVLGGGPIEAVIRILTGQNVVTDMPPGLRTTVAQMIDTVLKYPLGVAAAVVPRLDQFGLSNYVANGFDISGSLMGQTIGYAIGFVVPLFVAGYFFLKLREVAK